MPKFALPTLVSALKSRTSAPSGFGGKEEDDEYYNDQGGSDDGEDNYDFPKSKDYHTQKHAGAMHDMMAAFHGHDVDGLARAHEDAHSSADNIVGAGDAESQAHGHSNLDSVGTTDDDGDDSWDESNEFGR